MPHLDPNFGEFLTVKIALFPYSQQLQEIRRNVSPHHAGSQQETLALKNTLQGKMADYLTCYYSRLTIV
jgi:hypothetical protein